MDGSVIEQLRQPAEIAAGVGTAKVPVLTQRHTGERIASVLFLLPAILFLVLTSVYPLLYSFWLSLHSWNMTIPRSRPVWIGATNYQRLATDPEFANSLKVTLIFVVVAVTVEFVVGMGLALLATSRIRAVGLVRTVLLFPLMIAPVVAGVLWRTLFQPSYGVINWAFGLVGLPPQEWLGSPTQALPAVITVEIWQNLPVVAFVLAAGIQSLPVDLYKAAHVDGASQWQIFTRITLPLLRPVILVILLLRIMDAFKVFDIVFTMTYGGPGQTTELLSMLIYKTGFKFFQIGQASAMSWVFLVGIFLISLFFIRRLQRAE
ncbi:MAG TPA: sugar ABC transporter permease [Thermomicrobiales bacterium]|nr:sugar ABC transporter permease [Thermomicrobiales bacterium]